jgi:hypothetical protein
MQHALGATRSENLESLRVNLNPFPGARGISVDFNQGRSQADLETAAFGLISNIASIKDHLKLWCQTNGRQFGGEKLINTNRDVGLVHDLWNTDKHAKLKDPPRSGVRPRLLDLRQGLFISTGTEAGSAVSFSMDMAGTPTVASSGGGSVRLVIDGNIVDEGGSRVGGLQETCERAIAAWEKELQKSGVQIPP